MCRSKHFQTLGKSTFHAVIKIVIKDFFFDFPIPRKSVSLGDSVSPSLTGREHLLFMREVCTTSSSLIANRKVWVNQTHTVQGTEYIIKQNCSAVAPNAERASTQV